tara:strand:- start:95 stop:496 length:402 start_codon:yes stop_codon:yes gene_type:complete
MTDTQINQESERSTTIAKQNDEFRKGMRCIALGDLLMVTKKTDLKGEVFITQGISALNAYVRNMIFKMVQEFDQFNEDNDPYGEHDFGSIEFRGNSIFWKIDYYDLKREMGSPDPCDPSVTHRVLTIMLAEEY